MNLKAKVTDSWVYRYRGAILLMICAILTYFVIRSPRTTTTTVSIDNPLTLQKVVQLRDQNDKLYAKISQITLDKISIGKYTDSLSKALRIEKGNIKSVEKIVTRDSIIYRDHNTVAITNKENDIIAYSAEFQDSWVHIKAVAGKDTGSIFFTSKDTLTRIITEENHWFRPTQHNVFLGNANPHNEVTEGASFSIKEKKLWLTVGPYIGYDPFTQKPSIGIGVQLPILQFKR